MSCQYCIRNIRSTNNIPTKGSWCGICGLKAIVPDFPYHQLDSRINNSQYRKGDFFILIENLDQHLSQASDSLKFIIPIQLCLPLRDMASIRMKPTELLDVQKSSCLMNLDGQGYDATLSSDIDRNCMCINLDSRPIKKLLKQDRSMSELQCQIDLRFASMPLGQPYRVWIHASNRSALNIPELENSEFAFWIHGKGDNIECTACFTIVAESCDLLFNKKYFPSLVLFKKRDAASLEIAMEYNSEKNVINNLLIKRGEQRKIFFKFKRPDKHTEYREFELRLWFYGRKPDLHGFKKIPIKWSQVPRIIFVSPSDSQIQDQYLGENCLIPVELSMDRNLSQGINKAKLLITEIKLRVPSAKSEFGFDEYQSPIINVYDKNTNNTVLGNILELDSSAPREICISIDTTRLPWNEISDGALSDVVIQYQLEDRVKLRYNISIRLLQYRNDSSFEVSIDWGTSNSSVVFRDSDGAHPLGIGFNNSYSIPTIMKFRDLSNGPLAGECLVGIDAYESGNGTFIREFKLNFDKGEIFGSICDDFGNRFDVRKDDLARRFILELLLKVEKNQRMRISQLTCSFPTKWPRSASNRLNNLLCGVADDLSRRRGGNGPVVLFPTVDEASACMLWQVEDVLRKYQENHGLLEPVDVIAAIDIGGGTTDTALAKISIDPNNFDQSLKFDFSGFGGIGDFGGTDITKRIASKIAQSLSDFFKNHPQISNSHLPESLYAENLVPLQQRTMLYIQRQITNTEKLISIAEKMKIASAELDDANVQQVYMNLLLNGADALDFYRSDDSEAPFQKFETCIADTTVIYPRITYNTLDILNDNFQSSDLRQKSKSLDELLESIIRQIAVQASEAGIDSINCVVLAGGASKDSVLIDQLKLHASKFKNLFNGVVWIQTNGSNEYSDPKLLVAKGLSWYVKQQNDIGLQVNFASKLTHASLFIKSVRLIGKPILISRIGVDVNYCQKISFEPNLHFRKMEGKSGKLFVRDWTGTLIVLGFFDFNLDPFASQCVKAGGAIDGFIKYSFKSNMFVFESLAGDFCLQICEDVIDVCKRVASILNII